MAPSTAVQKSQVAQFISFTGAREKDAQKFLKASGWKLDQACDSYYATNGGSGSALTSRDKDALGKLFDKFRTSSDEEDSIGIDSTMKYLMQLGVNVENAEVMVALEIVQAPALGEISKKEFIEGWTVAGAETIPKQKEYVATQIRQLSTDIALFKKVYRHTFICSKEKGQKALPLDNALVYWELLFSPPGMTWATPSNDWLGLWTEYLRTNWTKSVNKDMWNQTFEFYQKSMQDESLSFWSEDGAWPGVIDEFVAYVKAKRGDIADSMETD